MTTVYIETSVVSFLRTNPKVAPESVLRQQITRTWWDFHSQRYDLVTTMRSIVLRLKSSRGQFSLPMRYWTPCILPAWP